ncbi:unnamed protein product [Prorocentrum cordatum]|uniref:Beta-galactosidase n=1 Tax=Prorocentrum cordatum TaxID=2364126 RepID=A0ABN9PGN7_9DINO|nr:unnamed protein product [Polarella glacialis]
MAGGFLKKDQLDAGGAWSVWPRRGGKTFKGFLGYGYSRAFAEGGRVAQDIDPADWDLVPFPVARTGPSGGGDSFYTDGDRAHRGDYSNLVGKTFRFTISGLGGLDCGCNANFYAVRVGAGCDGSGNNGGLCEDESTSSRATSLPGTPRCTPSPTAGRRTRTACAPATAVRSPRSRTSPPSTGRSTGPRAP